MMGVARPALPQRRVAPEQANASDPLKRSSYQSRVCGRMIGGVRLLMRLELLLIE
jgi:hypothetical protein